MHDLDLKATDLRGVLIGEARLERMNLEDANLEGAHLRHAKGILDAKLAGASYDHETQWTNGFTPAGHDPGKEGVQRVGVRVEA